VGTITEEEKASRYGRTYSACLDEYVNLISQEKGFFLESNHFYLSNVVAECYSCTW